ncbi:hypothetical protein PABG_02403 [Paracoccidioides brasiliensis Pb03]|nr:hypothetical protein PABG_02403 [Paracoccidioides brasiliensis Pb03]
MFEEAGSKRSVLLHTECCANTCFLTNRMLNGVSIVVVESLPYLSTVIVVIVVIVVIGVISVAGVTVATYSVVQGSGLVLSESALP